MKALGDAGGELQRSPAALLGPPLRSQFCQMGTACGSHLSGRVALPLAPAQWLTQVCRLLTFSSVSQHSLLPKIIFYNGSHYMFLCN